MLLMSKEMFFDNFWNKMVFILFVEQNVLAIVVLTAIYVSKGTFEAKKMLLLTKKR